ncbi:MAG: RNA pseudouridine synthase [Gammaproteobacteria bacterium]|nr:RNA pseudouridine synthase [Gammaproteobacteria bacterium]
MIIEKHILVTDTEQSILQLLGSELDRSKSQLSTAQLKQAINKGCLWLERGKKIKRIRRLKSQLQSDQQLHFYYNQKILSEEPLKAQLIEDNGAYSIWHKPAGMLCQGSKWGDHTTIYRYAEKQLKPQRNSIIVHRLDKMTSGLMILAHQRKIAAAFTVLFEQRQIEKHYRVMVQGHFKQAEKLLTLDTDLNNKSAISHIKLMEINQQSDRSILDVHIETGRKHQIRQHLSMAGYPVVGDRLYGLDNEVEERVEDLQLTAYKLQFICPLSGEVKKYQMDESKLPYF